MRSRGAKCILLAGAVRERKDDAHGGQFYIPYSGDQYELEHERGDLRSTIKYCSCHIVDGSVGTQPGLFNLRIRTARAARRRHQFGLRSVVHPSCVPFHIDDGYTSTLPQSMGWSSQGNVYGRRPESGKEESTICLKNATCVETMSITYHLFGVLALIFFSF